MSGVLAAMAAMTSGRLVGGMTVGNSGSNYGYVEGSYGALTVTTTFKDSAGNSRTVAIWNWDNVGNVVGFRLSGTGIANSDTTFIGVRVGAVGTFLTRASASYTADDGTGHTQWTWSTDTSAYPTSGTILIAVL